SASPASGSCSRYSGMRSPPEYLLATRSADKAREIRQILGGTVRLLTLDDAGIAPDPAEDDVEVHDTFVANAHAKAAYFARRSGLPVIADESGISIDALGGAPGVRSKRFSQDGARREAGTGTDAGPAT